MKTKILLAVPNLDGYGVQHDIRTLMKYWDHDRFEVKMLLHSRTGDFADQFPPDMASVEIDKYSSKIPKVRVISRLDGYRRAINEEKPDAVISFVPFCNYGCIWAKITSKHRFGLAVSEHAHVSAAMTDKQNMGNFFMRVYRLTFKSLYNSKFVDVVKCIAEESRQDLIKNHGIKEEKTILIHNPVPMEEVSKKGAEAVEHPWFKDGQGRLPVLINVGRISVQKQQDVLIKAFARAKKEIDCRLVIVGGGDQKELKDIASELGVSESVYFVGFDRNPWKWMAKSNLFVLSSIWEGLPCVLTEAMTLGLPVVSTKCPSGPREMLLEGQAGYLCEVGDMEGLAEKIVYALKNKEETRSRAEFAKKNLYRFEPTTVVKKYEELALRLADMYRDK